MKNVFYKLKTGKMAKFISLSKISLEEIEKKNKTSACQRCNVVPFLLLNSGDSVYIEKEITQNISLFSIILNYCGK